MDNSQQYDRYHRQQILPGFGIASQQKLQEAKVLVIGAGGLGCPVLQYLVAAGVGSIGIADDDAVSLNNLHRQVLYNVEMIGQLKVSAAIRVLQKLNPTIRFTAIPERITNMNAERILSPYDIVIDCSDNFPTRYLVNDSCVLFHKPLIYGAVSQFDGQLAVFNMPDQNGQAANYRDLFPQPPVPGEVLNCEEGGVLGTVPGIIGTMMANEAIKMITGIGEPLINQLFTYDSRTNASYKIAFNAKKETLQLIPRSNGLLMQTDYGSDCSTPPASSEINWQEFSELFLSEEVTIIDVRTPEELPHIDEFDHLQIPLNELMGRLEELKSDHLVLFCQSGKRSRQASQSLKAIFGERKKISSLAGGILAWRQAQNHSA